MTSSPRALLPAEVAELKSGDEPEPERPSTGGGYAQTEKLDPDALARIAAKETSPTPGPVLSPTVPLPDERQQRTDGPDSAAGADREGDPVATSANALSGNRLVGDAIALVLGLVFGAVLGWVYLNHSTRGASELRRDLDMKLTSIEVTGERR